MENQTKEEVIIPEAPTEEVVVTNPPGAPSTPQNGHQYGGFWIRFLAVIIDSIILSVIGSLFGATTINGGMVSVNFVGWKFIIPLAYTLGFWIWQGATPGKIILGLKIIEEGDKKLTWQKAVIRYFSMIISAIPFMLGFIWAGFEPQKRTWHDLLARTYVIKTK